MAILTLSPNDFLNGLIKKNLVIKKKDEDLILVNLKEYREMLQELEDFKFWNKIDRRNKNIEAGKVHFHELIEVDVE